MSEIQESSDSIPAVTEDSVIQVDGHSEAENPASGIPSISDDFLVNGKQTEMPCMKESTEISNNDTLPRLSPSDANPESNSTADGRVARLETELLKAQSLIRSLQSGRSSENGGTENEALYEHDADISNHEKISLALQLNLEQQMNAKAEAENKVRLLESSILNLEEQLKKQQEEISKNETLHENLQLQMIARAEAENKARSAYDRIQQLESEKEINVHDLKLAHEEIIELRETVVDKDRELDKVRLDRDEYERKVAGLTTRLNGVKKNDAVKVNHLDDIENDLEVALQELEHTKSDLQKALTLSASLEQKLKYSEGLAKERIYHLESLLKEEQQLNEERKMKMKDYVEKKSEELRQVQEENNSLQIELTQTNHSLVELNSRWKQLHTQWVQAQTWNRELQRDILRMKKDSENLHKQGDTLEMKLSRSTNETEEHKNKRFAAKQELLSVLQALENERGLTAKICDKIKFSFTPRLLTQQQAVKEILEELVASLEKLAIRFGKPLPTHSTELTNDEDASYDANNDFHSKNLTSSIGEDPVHSDVGPLLEKFESESQNLSGAISSVAMNIDRLHMLVQANGDRNCFTVLSELVSTGTMVRSPALQVERHSLPNPLGTIGRSHRYGQVPDSIENL
jgi:DNA repair exonuclease SbcCD ATPase subunit